MSAQRQSSRRNPTPASSTNNNPTDRSTETRGDPTCVVCLEDRAPTRVLDACRHAYCQADLRKLVEAALDGRGSWPPRCCGDRNRPDEDDVQWALESDPALYEKYLEMRWERNTPLPEKGQGEGERVDKRLKALMKEQRWRSCGRCGRVIEKTSGCDHISCRCGHEFCYICGKIWQTCACAFGAPPPDSDDESDNDSVAGTDTGSDIFFDAPESSAAAANRGANRAQQTARAPPPRQPARPAVAATNAAPQPRRPQPRVPDWHIAQGAEHGMRDERGYPRFAYAPAPHYGADATPGASRAARSGRMPNHRQGGSNAMDRHPICTRGQEPDPAGWLAYRPQPGAQPGPIVLHPVYDDYVIDPYDGTLRPRQQPCAQCIAAGCPNAQNCSGYQ